MFTDDDGDFSEEEAVNAGIERHEEYIENVELNDDGDPVEDIDEYFERKNDEDIEGNKQSQGSSGLQANGVGISYGKGRVV